MAAMSKDLARELGISTAVYYRQRALGKSHEEAIDYARTLSAGGRKSGNPIDWTSAGAGQIIRGWKRGGL
jgi:hypothetical protein